MQEDLGRLGVSFEPFTPRQAELAAALWSRTHRYGLSLADRACLALALDRSLPVMTADRTWAQLDLGLEVRVLR